MLYVARKNVLARFLYNAIKDLSITEELFSNLRFGQNCDRRMKTQLINLDKAKWWRCQQREPKVWAIGRPSLANC